MNRIESNRIGIMSSFIIRFTSNYLSSRLQLLFELLFVIEESSRVVENL